MRHILQQIAYGIKKTANVLVLVFVLVGSFAVGFMGVGYPAFSQIGTHLPVFGGRIGAVVYCPCSAGYVDIVTVPKVATVYVQPGVSRVYMYYMNFRPGVWTLGDYTPGSGQCLIYAVSGCVTYNVQGTVRQTGTSLTIAQ